jgi:hypothetical protein
MAANPAPELPNEPTEWGLARVHAFPGLRALTWDHTALYASVGYGLFRANITEGTNQIEWQPVARYRPEVWRNLSSSLGLTSRLFRDGFHALSVLPSGHMVAAVPGAIITLAPEETQFRVSHKMLRGKRPLHLTATPDGHIFWGEYFDNPNRAAVHIYGSTDLGANWDVTHTFPKGAVRHVHNIVHDPWGNCLWILTGDNGAECRILRASCDFKDVDLVLSGNQQVRAVALVPGEHGLYFSSDTPLERNHVYHLDRAGKLSTLAELSSSSIYGCRVRNAIFFSTMVEPSPTNLERSVSVIGTLDLVHWKQQLGWRKDHWPMGLFQYGNAFFPDGNNATDLLALTTIAVRSVGLETSLWRVVRS